MDATSSDDTCPDETDYATFFAMAETNSQFDDFESQSTMSTGFLAFAEDVLEEKVTEIPVSPATGRPYASLGVVPKREPYSNPECPALTEHVAGEKHTGKRALSTAPTSEPASKEQMAPSASPTSEPARKKNKQMAPIAAPASELSSNKQITVIALP
jgi:hypothetical protein